MAPMWATWSFTGKFKFLRPAGVSSTNQSVDVEALRSVHIPKLKCVYMLRHIGDVNDVFLVPYSSLKHQARFAPHRRLCRRVQKMDPSPQG